MAQPSLLKNAVLGLGPDSGCFDWVVDLLALGDEIETQLLLDLCGHMWENCWCFQTFSIWEWQRDTTALGYFNFSCVLPTFDPIHNLILHFYSHISGLFFSSDMQCQVSHCICGLFSYRHSRSSLNRNFHFPLTETPEFNWPFTNPLHETTTLSTLTTITWCVNLLGQRKMPYHQV